MKRRKHILFTKAESDAFWQEIYGATILFKEVIDAKP